MKILKKIKLIHWHYFINETIHIHHNALLTGENGAGKSTLLDAIQYVLTAGKVKFNTAANSNAKRNLEGYVRCKVGTDTKMYLREGDVTSHVALQFYDDELDKHFIIGCVIDISANITREKVLFYTLENKEISDDLFIEDDAPLDIRSFKRSIKDFKHQMEEGKEKAKNIFLNRLGQLESKYIELLPKALAFRPLDDVKDFVYSFVLDEKEIKIDLLRNNVRQYRQFQKILEDTRERITDLKQIIDLHESMTHHKNKIDVKEFVIIKATHALLTKELSACETKIKQTHVLIDRLNTDKHHVVKKELELKEEEKQINQALITNETYQRKESLKNKLSKLQAELNQLSPLMKRLETTLVNEKSRISSINQQIGKQAVLETFLIDANKGLYQVDLDRLKHQIENVLTTLTIASEEQGKQKYQVEQRLKETNHHLNEVNLHIQDLENQRIRYDVELLKLKLAIEEDIRKFDQDFQALVFCELLEVKDEKWRNALEGYLNTQRFDLIVDPKYFDQALNVYEKVKLKEKIHGIGLVNVEKILRYQEVWPNSLASKVSAESEFARCYANMILNKVYCSEEVDDLKQHKCAITPTCMVYQNNTARQINERVYQKPYIGKQAIERQLKMYQEQKGQLEVEKKRYEKELLHIEGLLKEFNTSDAYFLMNHLERVNEFKAKENDLKETTVQLKSIKDDESFIDLQMRLDKLEDELKALENKKESISKNIGKNELNLEQLINSKNNLEQKVNEAYSSYQDYRNQHPMIEQVAMEEFEKSVLKVDLPKLIENATNRKTYYINQFYKLEKELIGIQKDFNNKFQFGGGEGDEGIDLYINDYIKLTKTELLKHEDEVRRLKEQTEIEFKEHFVARIRENIKEAQKELRKLNRALQNRTFGTDQYSFSYSANSKYKKFYDMIMDDDNLEGQNLFTDSFASKHNEAMKELFDKIVIDDDQAEQAMAQYTDYRTYMDYDIKIHHENGDTSSFSKVSREKSGGETQTPFYVIIAASFVQLFSNARNSACLVFFDEAFNNMDEGRIQTMMEFYNQLNLQMIIAVPSQRMDTI